MSHEEDHQSQVPVMDRDDTFDFGMDMSPRPALADLTDKEKRGNEWVAANAEYILRDREHMLMHPGEVPIFIYVAPTGAGKSVISGQSARADVQGLQFQRQLPLKADGTRKELLILHVSLSQGIEEAAYEAGISKDQATPYEEYRVKGTERMIDAVDAFSKAFTNHPDYNAQIRVDTVGVTTSDLGTSLVSKFAQDPRARILAVMPDPRIERHALSLRSGVAANPDDPNTVFLLHRVNPGADLKGNTQEFVDSCGTEAAWERHWKDIFAQMQEGMEDFDSYGVRDEDAFLEDAQTRYRMYEYWLPQRMAELGVDVTNRDRFEIIPNQWIDDELHIHFGRMYGKKTREPGKFKRHFPMRLLDPRNGVSQITPEMILGALGELTPEAQDARTKIELYM